MRSLNLDILNHTPQFDFINLIFNFSFNLINLRYNLSRVEFYSIERLDKNDIDCGPWISMYIEQVCIESLARSIYRVFRVMCNRHAPGALLLLHTFDKLNSRLIESTTYLRCLFSPNRPLILLIRYD